MGTRSPAAGLRPGRAPSPALRGDFCFCFPLVLLGMDSIHFGLSGRFGEIYIFFFFSVVVAVLFPRGRQPALGQGGPSGEGC